MGLRDCLVTMHLHHTGIPFCYFRPCFTEHSHIFSPPPEQSWFLLRSAKSLTAVKRASTEHCAGALEGNPLLGEQDGEPVCLLKLDSNAQTFLAWLSETGTARRWTWPIHGDSHMVDHQVQVNQVDDHAQLHSRMANFTARLSAAEFW